MSGYESAEHDPETPEETIIDAETFMAASDPAEVIAKRMSLGHQDTTITQDENVILVEIPNQEDKDTEDDVTRNSSSSPSSSQD